MVLVAAAGSVLGSLLFGCASGATEPSTRSPVTVLDAAPAGPFRGAEPATPYTMPRVVLTADDGISFPLGTDPEHPITLVFFGYTHCPDECPLVMNELAHAYAELSPEARQQTRVLFITTDPRRDSGEVLRRYLNRYNPAFLGLRGRMADITTAAKAMGVAITGAEPLPGGGYDIGHGAQVIGFRGARAPVVWTVGTPAADIVADVERLAGR